MAEVVETKAVLLPKPEAVQEALELAVQANRVVAPDTTSLVTRTLLTLSPLAIRHPRMVKVAETKVVLLPELEAVQEALEVAVQANRVVVPVTTSLVTRTLPTLSPLAIRHPRMVKVAETKSVLGAPEPAVLVGRVVAPDTANLVTRTLLTPSHQTLHLTSPVMATRTLRTVEVVRLSPTEERLVAEILVEEVPFHSMFAQLHQVTTFLPLFT
jgi:propanediol dehydratase small subunit